MKLKPNLILKPVLFNSTLKTQNSRDKPYSEMLNSPEPMRRTKRLKTLLPKEIATLKPSMDNSMLKTTTLPARLTHIRA